MPERSHRRYALDHLMAHVRGERDHARLCRLVEEKGFLALQAQELQDFGPSERDLISCILPSAIATQDWPRFLRYALTALNLGRLAEGLAEEPILRNLILHGRRGLAKSLVGQVADPERRARGRAVLLGVGAKDEAGDEKKRLAQDLEAVPPPVRPEAGRGWLETLRVLARHLDPVWLHGRWAGWIGRLDSLPESVLRAELRRESWRVLVDRWMECDLSPTSGLWQALDTLRNLGDVPGDRDPLTPDRILTSLPRELAERSARSGRSYLARLPAPLDRDARMLWHLRLATWASCRPLAEELDRFVGRLRNVAGLWTLELVEVGRGLWGRLETAHLEALAASIAEPDLRAGLLVVALEERAVEGSTGADLAEAALDCLEVVPLSDRQLHWYLRYLGAQRADPAMPARLLSVVRHLEKARYGARTEDLALFLDLVAEAMPDLLNRQVDGVVWCPDFSAERLLTLARSARSRRLLNRLAERAEEYAVVVANTQPDGFRLRCDLLSEVTRRLVVRWNDPASLGRAVPRLLDDEEDQLRIAVVDDLTGRLGGDELAKKYRRELAQCVAQGVRSPRLRLLAWLRVASEGDRLQRTLEPAALYAAVASTQDMEDEIQALRPWTGGNLADPMALADRHLSQVRDPDRRVLALTDLARASLIDQRRRLGARWLDSTAALEPLRQQAGALSSDALLARYTPELVAAVSLAEPERAALELQEAVRRVLTFEGIDDLTRLEVVERLLTAAVEMARVEEGDEPSQRRYRLVAAAVRWLARLPSRDEFGAAGLRTLWPRLLPLVAALPWRLPGLAAAYVRHPKRTRFLVDDVPTVTRWIGLERAWLFCARLERILPFGWLDRRRSPWVRGEEAFASWLRPCQRSALAAFLRRDRNQFESCVERTLKSAEVEELEIETLAFLASSLCPDRVPDLVLRAAPGAAGDQLCLRLVRGGWLSGELARRLIDTIADDAVRLEARAWSDLSAEPDTHWLSDVRRLVGDHGIDFLDPGKAELRRKTLRADRAEARVAFAQAAASALGTGARGGAACALRLWLSAGLPVSPRKASPLVDIEDAITAARLLPHRRAELIR